MNKQMQFSRRYRAAKQAGFSLMEIIIVVTLMGLVLGFAANQIFGGADKAKAKLANSQMKSLALKIEEYRMDNEDLPNSLDNLVSQPGGADNWMGPYAKKADLKDPWGTPIEFSKSGASFTLKSLGKDKAAGGDGLARDFTYSPEE